MSSDLELLGFAEIRGVLAAEEITSLIELLGPVTGAGRRGLLGIPAIARLATSEKLLDLIRPFLPAEPVAVRGIYFDKSPEANWPVPWHQDLTIAVRTAADVRGFGPWSTKDGIPHVQPPPDLLAQMITIRLHLDPADSANGALRVLGGTHLNGRLSTEEIRAAWASVPEHLCTALPGDALLMRPLLLHASSRALQPVHRRILHLEYAGFELPSGLGWAESSAG